LANEFVYVLNKKTVIILYHEKLSLLPCPDRSSIESNTKTKYNIYILKLGEKSLNNRAEQINSI